MFAPGLVGAQDLQFISTDGDLFSYEKNRHGAVLTAIDPSENPLVKQPIVSGIPLGDVIYLGRSCDAFSDRLGDGTWRATAAGFVVVFRARRVVFPGQVIDVSSGDRCGI